MIFETEKLKIRDLKESDYSQILKLNNDNLPAVSELTNHDLKKLHDQALAVWVIEDSLQGSLAGFCIILPPGIDYSSDNYKWITERYDEFEYLDRVVISKEFRGQGFGRALYDYWFTKSSSESLLLEVNTKPINKGSITFHEKVGFCAIGEQEILGGEKRVQYMIRKKLGL